MIDKQSPFKGKLGKYGYFHSEISLKSISNLEKIYKSNPKNIFFSVDSINSIKEIFSILNPIVKDYLGNNSFIDGINWLHDKPSKNFSMSSNWHIDNVGNRLKCFICIRGDGEMPTLIMPSKQRIPILKEWINNTFFEWIRWLGVKNQRHIQGYKKLSHKTKSVYLFDTVLLHRGAYELAKDDRLILNIEFSNPEKHKYKSGLIGTHEHNSFCFDREFFTIPEFKDLIDQKRLIKESSKFTYGKYVPN